MSRLIVLRCSKQGWPGLLPVNGLQGDESQPGMRGSTWRWAEDLRAGECMNCSRPRWMMDQVRQVLQQCWLCLRQGRENPSSGFALKQRNDLADGYMALGLSNWAAIPMHWCLASRQMQRRCF